MKVWGGGGSSVWRRALSALILTVAIVALTGASAQARPAKVVLSAPTKVGPGQSLRVRVATTAMAPFKVELQQQQGHRWKTVARRSVGRGGSTALLWKVRSGLPYLTLRAVVTSGHGRLVSRVHRVRIARRVAVLQPADVELSPAPGEAGLLTYGGNLDIHPGSIVAAGTGPQTPDGFLGLVSSVTHKGGVTEVGTQPTTLLAAIPSGNIEAEVGQTEAHASSAGGGLTRSVSRMVKCTKGGEVSIEGGLSLSPTATFRASWSLFGGVSSRFEAGLDMDGNLTASAQAAAKCKVGPVTLAQWTLTPIDVQVGPVPVVLVPVIKVILEGDGSVSAQVATAFHGKVTASGGVAYEGGKVKPVGGVTTKFSFQPPAPQANAHLAAAVGPTMSLLVYGVAGPEVDLRTGVSLDASTAANPWWKLTAPVDLDGKLSIPLLGLETGAITIYHKSFLLAQASGPFAPAPPPAPAPPSVITFVGSPGTDPPPAALGPYTMHPFSTDPQEFGTVVGVAGPTGAIAFSTALDHLHANEEPAWSTWSNGYEGDVYFDEESPAVTVALPAGTKAFYLYAEPDEFATFNFSVHTQDGTSSGQVPVFGEAGARFFGFYATGAATIQSVTVESPENLFAIGEFGISSG